MTSREILIGGAIVYWCEGAKRKPHSPSERVIFINSHPELIRLFLRLLEAAGVDSRKLRFRVQIHETADIARRRSSGCASPGRTGADRAQLYRTTFLHHNLRTVRRNVGCGYQGCFRLEVMQSAELYRMIEGWVCAVTSSGQDDGGS